MMKGFRVIGVGQRTQVGARNGEDGEEPMREGKSSETTHSTIPRKELMRWMQRRCQKGCRISLVFRLFLLSSS